MFDRKLLQNFSPEETEQMRRMLIKIAQL